MNFMVLLRLSQKKQSMSRSMAGSAHFYFSGGALLRAGRRPVMAKIFHCRSNAAALVRHAGQSESHLDAAQGSAEHEIVEVAEMADAEHLVRDFAEPAAERQVEMIEHDLAQLHLAVALRHQHGGERA